MGISRTRRSCCLIVAGLVMLAACNGDDDATPTTVTPPTAAPTTGETEPSTTTPPTTSTAPSTSPDTSDEATDEAPTSTSSAPTTSDDSSTTAPTTTPTTTSTNPDAAAAETAWTELLTATADPGGDANALDQVATQAMVDQMTTFFRLAGPDGVDVTTFPTATVNADGTATIEDCIWHSPDVSDDPSFHFTATAQPTNTGYQIASITPQGPGCVPRELAEPALAAYAEFREVTVELGRNPDPDDPRLAQLATGVTLESFRTAVRGLAADGHTLWFGGESHPYPLEFPRPDTVVVRNCILPEDEFGRHDESGELISGSGVEPGKQYVEILDMLNTNDGWRANDGGAFRDSECDPDQLVALEVVGS